MTSGRLPKATGSARPGQTRPDPNRYQPGDFGGHFRPFSDAVFGGRPPRIVAGAPPVTLHPFLAFHAKVFNSNKSSKPPWLSTPSSSVQRPFFRLPERPNSPNLGGFMWRLHSRSPEGQNSPPSSISSRRASAAGKRLWNQREKSVGLFPLNKAVGFSWNLAREESAGRNPLHEAATHIMHHKPYHKATPSYGCEIEGPISYSKLLLQVDISCLA
ncbi:hypothetical protein LWI29_010239 [Acer saccharum]|uniref:Uncharacterized protein n=1 Tax=Acer saccharum TaxID=4024 RepID=A0AA39RIQ7_ACESA|nr:hypothetical protein LWI29_010239 [Acer saccharum]